MKITRLNEVEVIDVAPVEVATIEVAPAPVEVLPEPLADSWLVDARQAVVEAQAHHTQVVANIASIAASLEALQSDLAEAEASLKAADHPDLTGDLDADLATIELQASHGAALSGRCAMLRRKIPMVQSVLKNAEAQEREARHAVQDAQEDAFKGWADMVKLDVMLFPLLQYRAALRAAGRGELFRFKLDEVLNSNRLEERAHRELLALLAIPGKEPVIDNPVESLPPPTAPALTLVCNTPGMDIGRAMGGYEATATPLAPVNEYHQATADIYAARSLPKAA